MSALGKGLKSLINSGSAKNQSHDKNQDALSKPKTGTDLPPVSVEEIPEGQSGQSIFLVEVNKISPNPHQPRQTLDRGELLDLASSIKEHGVIQPLVVGKKRKTSQRGQDVRYYLIAGHRRLEAAKMAGLPHVPVVVREASDQEKLELALIENIQRSDLNPIEKAKAFKKLQEEFNLTHDQIGRKVGKSRESVTNTIRLLNLPGEIQQAVIAGKISEGHARGLAGVKDKAEMMKVYKDVLNQGLTVREVESRAQEFTVKEHKRKAAFLSEVKEFQERLTGALGYPVKITKSGLGGRVVVPFKDKNELEQIVKRVSG
jgi:ParB family chromosome partitioning protein